MSVDGAWNFSENLSVFYFLHSLQNKHINYSNLRVPKRSLESAWNFLEHLSVSGFGIGELFGALWGHPPRAGN